MSLVEQELDKERCRRDARREKMKIYQAAYVAKHPDKVKEAKRRFREKNPGYLKGWLEKHPGYDRTRLLSKKYGLTKEQYQERLEAQGGCCVICRDGKTKRDFHIDHEHTTGRIRGLLCSRCNTGLGQFRDSIGFLAKAQEYLRENLT